MNTDFYSDENISKINDLINKSSDSILCDPKCQYNRYAENLKQNYLDAKTKLLNAPEQISIAEKKYYTFIGGDSLYDEKLEEQLKVQLNEKINEFNSIFNKEKQNAKNLIDGYSLTLKNSINTYELYDKYLLKIIALKEEIKNSSLDVFTNDRKIEYESKELENINSNYIFYLIFYFIISLVFILLLFFKNKGYKLFTKIFITIALIIYPFIVQSIVSFIVYFFTLIYSFLPRNVYNNL